MDQPDDTLYLRPLIWNNGSRSMMPDFNVIWKGKTIGRIHRSPDFAEKWDWAINLIGFPPSVRNAGSASTREEAMRALRKRWDEDCQNIRIRPKPSAG